MIAKTFMIQGTGLYLHCLFANHAFRHALLRQNSRQRPLTLEVAFDHLADAVEAHLDMTALENIIGW